MRQTDLTREQIASILGGKGHSPFPRCLLINELGELAKAGDAEAEKDLRSFLADGVPEDEHAIAYCCLGTLEAKSPETAEALRAFADKPENAPIVGWAFEQYEIAPPEKAE